MVTLKYKKDGLKRRNPVRKQKRWFIKLLVLVSGLGLWSGCVQQKFDFNQNLPYVNARLFEVFPATIRGTMGKELKLDFTDDRYIGYTQSYLEGRVTITVVKCLDKELTFEQLIQRKEPTQAALDYFDKTIKGRYAAFPSHSIGYKENFWQATGRDKKGRRWLAWINAIWAFEISGSNQEDFDLAVRACRFVSKMGETE